jgi:hypothetical protein
MCGWLHSNEALKENIKRYLELGNSFSKFAQRCIFLISCHFLEKKICKILKKQWTAGQFLHEICVQALIKAIFTLREP